MPLVADYGTSLPKVPLAFATTAALVSVGAAGLGAIGLAALAAGTAAVFGASAVSSFYAGRIGRMRVWSDVLAELALRGDERVLDVGCGRGALLVQLARRLPRGKVVGFHPWRAGDTEAQTRANVVAEGMADRVTLQAGDLRSMPFLDRTFPLVVSSLALHGIAEADGRARAVSEMWRVLADGGTLLIVDLRHTADYARTLEHLGARTVTRRDLGWRFWSGGPHVAGALIVARRP